MKNLKLIFRMGLDDFKKKYSGAAFGSIWAFIQPIITIVMYWIVFEFGLKSVSAIPDVPFVIWMMAALVPYLFLTEAVNGTMNCFIEYGYLVKKTMFDIKILPGVKIVSSLIVHVAFLLFVIILACILGVYPTWYMLQILYYTPLLIIYILSLSFFLSSIIVFFKDMGQVVNIILQIGMWATPIFWSTTILGDSMKWLLYINPVYYITEGYRDAICGNAVLFYQRPIEMAVFFGFVLFNFLISFYVYKKLRNQFAEVL